MFPFRNWFKRPTSMPRPMPRRLGRVKPGFENLESRLTPAAEPVLLVLPNADFWYADYAQTRQALESAGVEVEVAAATTDMARPQWGSGFGADGGLVRPDIALADVDASDYSAIAFVGGWGASQYQYAFNGTYGNAAYNGSASLRETVNNLIDDFVEQDKHVAGVCYGVSVLAWARVDGQSPLEGRQVTGWHGAGPWSTVSSSTSGTWHMAANGAAVVPSTMVGMAGTSHDDVIVDGKIITAENFASATRFGEVLAQEVIAAATASTPPEAAPEAPPATPAVLPALMVLANQDFYYREYSETRASLEAAGVDVVVTAGAVDWCRPHADSGQGASSGWVMPDLALADVDAADYSAIVFVGGWGASSYQYAFEGTYANGAYNGSGSQRAAVNDLINDFVDQDKYVTAICHGVSVLAWARVDGQSPLAGRTVSAYAGYSPPRTDNLPGVNTTRWHVESNGGDMIASGSAFDPRTVADDVIVDGRIITAENYDTAAEFGRVLARELWAS